MATSAQSAADHEPDEQRSFTSIEKIDADSMGVINDFVTEEPANSPAHTCLSSPSDTVPIMSQVGNSVTQCWLTAQCEMITGTTLGLVLDAKSSLDDLKFLAHWPEGANTVPAAMIEAAQKSLQSPSTVVVSNTQLDTENSKADQTKCYVISPLSTDESDGLLAVFELPCSVRQQQQAIIQLLQWGSVWFGLLVRNSEVSTPINKVQMLAELLASSLEHTQFHAATTTVVTELAVKLKCSRVSLGLTDNKSVSVRAMSNSAKVDIRANLTQAITTAMNEAVDQNATLTWPAQTKGLRHVTFAQESLAKHTNGTSILTTPLYDGPDAIGALTLERDGNDTFDQDCKEFCETLSGFLGPVLALKYDKEKSVIKKVGNSIREQLHRLFGPEHLARKLYALILLAGVVFLSLATGDYRITAQARLEGSIKRVVTAPLDGFVASATYRAGDIVKTGDVLAQLNDRDLLLEQLQLNSQREQLDKEHRAALTSHDRSATAIIAARKQQTDAQIALVNEQLLRTQLTVPFDGVVVSGDLSQSIGSPVENGQVLFEVAPLDNYRVVLEVDERDIGDILDSQRGSLTLTGLPDLAQAFTVSRIVPLSTPRNGRNVFEVQAELDAPSQSIRPGMEGVAKIDVDQRKLIWVWTHELIDWLRLSVWTWIT